MQISIVVSPSVIHLLRSRHFCSTYKIYLAFIYRKDKHKMLLILKEMFATVGVPELFANKFSLFDDSYIFKKIINLIYNKFTQYITLI